MNKKLVEEAESLKQYVIDEYNKLFGKYQKLEDINNVILKRSKNMNIKHQELITLSLKLTNENERMSKKLASIDNMSKIELLEKQLSHNDLINQNHKLVKENTNLSHSNAKYIALNGELIKFFNTLEVVQIKEAHMFLKKLLELKYQVVEIKHEEDKKETSFNPEFLKDLLTKHLGKDFHVEVIGGNERSQQVMRDLFGNLETEKKSDGGNERSQQVMRDLFGNLETEKKSKRNDKRDNLGRFTSKK